MHFNTTTDIHHPLFKASAHIRSLVFVQEQGFNESEELDDLQQDYTYVVGFKDDTPLATARLHFDVETSTCIIERVAILKEGRGQGFGKQLFEFIETVVSNQSIQYLRLDAQDNALLFYESIGFRIDGLGFMEYDRPHHTMIKRVHA